MATTNLTTALSASISQRHSLSVSPAWLTTFLSSIRQPLPPLAALTSTAHFRMLNSDFTTSLTPSNLLPDNVADVSVKELRLPFNVPVQVLDVEDIGRSRWSQIEAIERIERGEEIRGREVIRTLPAERNGDDAPPVSGTSHGPHKILLQDAKGTKVVAFEQVRIPRIGIGEEGMAIGMKLLLKEGTVVRRGMILLRPEDIVLMGGRIEVWDKAWREGMKQRLTREIEREGERSLDA